MNERQSDPASLLPTAALNAAAAVSTLATVGRSVGLSSAEPPQPPLTTQARPINEGEEEPEVQEGGSPIFPFRCLPLVWLGMHGPMTKVQDWLHFVLFCGVLASVLCVINVVLEIVWNECGMSPSCYTDLFCSLIIVPSTCRFVKEIVKYDEQAKRFKDLEEGKANQLAAEQAIIVTAISKEVDRLSQFADKMTQKIFKEKMRAMRLFLDRVDRDHGGVTVNDMLPQFKEFVVSWVVTLGKARLAHVQRDNDPVDQLVSDIWACETIGGVRDAWETGIRDIVTKDAKTFWKDVPSAVNQDAAEQGNGRVDIDDIRPCLNVCGIQRGAFSRLCGGHARCGASWLKFRGAEGPQPEFCKIERSPAGPQAFSPFTLHVLGLFTVKILNNDHWIFMLLFLLDIAVMIFQVIDPGQVLALDVVFVNSVCILSMLLCFEQINNAELHAVRIAKISGEIEKVKKHQEELQVHFRRKESYQDALEYRTFPLLDVMGQVNEKYQLAPEAALRSGEVFEAANKCIQAFDQSFGPLQDWLGAHGRLSEQWKRGAGADWKRYIDDWPDEQVLDGLIQHLRVGSSVAAGAAPKFIEDITPQQAALAIAPAQQALPASTAVAALLDA